jgi:1,4-dihydroxy-2-naphthoate octaprenyltransferase
VRAAPLLRLARPHFLLGGALLFALGAVAAGSIDATGYAVGQAMVTAIQLTAHLANEFADAEADRHVEHRTWFSGGSGVLASGALPRQAAVRAAVGTSLVAAAAIGGIATRSLPAAAIGAGALAIAWLYSVAPVRLLGTGLGELATSLVVAGGVPLVGALASGAGVIPPGLWWSVASLVPIHLAMMLCFELPDLDSDRRAGKRVLAVRLGRWRTGVAALGLAGMGGAIMALGVATGALPGAAALSLAALIPAAGAARSLRRDHWGGLTLGAVATLVVAATGLLVALA